ncbi:hypothetical protein BD408DRAFT_334911 [Parasitella parasitica]|nr:hypothetical protein BD408DRAFT_334911 [Parasitella parasitica]
MVLLVLYYVHKWMTVPWAYYESARSRHIMHQKLSNERTNAGILHIPKNEQEAFARRMQRDHSKSKSITAELRRHELAGLLLVVLSPAIAGYTLQYSRYLLSNIDRYINAFNVTIFILAASIRPLTHVMTLLQRRTAFLQSEALASENQVQVLQAKLDILEKELYGLRKAFATKQDLGQLVTEDIKPSLQQFAKKLKRFEKQDPLLRNWFEEKFAAINYKVREFDQYIRVEQDQRQKTHGMIVSLILLPLRISLWVVKRLASLLSSYHSSCNLLAVAAAASESTYKALIKPPSASAASTSTSKKPSWKRQRSTVSSQHQMSTVIPDPTETIYSTEESIAAFGH